MDLKVAARQCTDETGCTHRFHYFLTIDQEETGCFFCEDYGVRIADDAGGQTSIPRITTSASRIDELLTLLVEHLVGPAGLRDVVEDWL